MLIKEFPQQCSRTFLVILDTLIYHCSFDTLVDIKQKQSSKQSTSFRSAWFIACSVHSRILPSVLLVSVTSSLAVLGSPGFGEPNVVQKQSCF